MGIHYFSYFCSKTYIVGPRKNRLGEAVQTGIHNQYFEQKYENYQNFYLKTFIFLW